MSTPFRHPYVSDLGDGNFRNPVLHADYSDPDVIRHGDDFYMTASSFNCTPGLPILHSKDLINWTLIAHAIEQVPHSSYSEVRPGCGVWAPAIRFHGGKFWIFFPMPDEGIYVTNADHPAGPWSEPWCLQEAKGWIDPCPFWDDDGKAYLAHAYANSRAGKKERIHLRPMTPDCRTLLGEGKELFHTPHHLYLEGPKLHKLNGWYYILAPGGGVPTGWQVVFRSRDLWGPYEEKIVLERGSTNINGPHQGALIDLKNDEWWFMHFQDAGPFGRIAHLQPVRWENEWPLMGVDYDGNGVGEPVPTWKKPDVGATHPIAVPVTSDEFDSETLSLAWQWHANHQDNWTSLTARPGWLRQYSQPVTNDDLGRTQHLLAQKFPARAFAVETLLEFHPQAAGENAGLAIIGGGEHASISLHSVEGGTSLVLNLNGQSKAHESIKGNRVRLRVTVDENALCTFGWALPDGTFHDLHDVFATKEGGWIGAKIGLFSRVPNGLASGGWADYDYFRFTSGK